MDWSYELCNGFVGLISKHPNWRLHFTGSQKVQRFGLEGYTTTCRFWDNVAESRPGAR